MAWYGIVVNRVGKLWTALLSMHCPRLIHAVFHDGVPLIHAIHAIFGIAKMVAFCRFLYFNIDTVVI